MNLWGVARLGDVDPALCRGAKLSERAGGATSVVVLGAGSSMLFEHYLHTTGQGAIANGQVNGQVNGQANGHAAACRVGFSDWVRARVADEVEALRAADFSVTAVFPGDPRQTCFAQMAEAAGLVIASPVVDLLLHPRYGPWVEILAALVVDAPLPVSGELDFDPCSSCSAPCLAACPVETYVEPGRVELGRCATHRHAGGCASGCEVRRACPVGREARFADGHEVADQQRRRSWLRRRFGLGVWRLVPAALRRRGS